MCARSAAPWSALADARIRPIGVRDSRWAFMPAAGSSSSSRRGSLGERPGDLEPALIDERELAGRHVRRAPSPTRSSSSSAVGRACASSPQPPGNPAQPPRRSPRVVRAWQPTITFSTTLMPRNSRTCWNFRAIPASGDPVRAPAGDVRASRTRRRPAVGANSPAEHVEQRGLACAVWPDQRVDLSRPRLHTRHCSMRDSRRNGD